MSADTALRANVRLLGDLLGSVLVEQEGAGAARAEERIRALARAAREGEPRDELRGRRRRAPARAAGLVLRAFALFFQLANIAEQHHRAPAPPRVRARGPRAARVARRGVRASSPAAGVGRGALAGGGRASRVELVLTAHPTEATRRTILEAHRRIAALLRELDDPELPPSERRARRAELAEEITILWQTDEIRSRRPRVVDEIRQGLWFFEQSLWDAVPRAARATLRRASSADAAAPLRFGTLDRRRSRRQPARRRRDDRGRARAGPRSSRASSTGGEMRALGAAWGMSTTRRSARSPELGGRATSRTGPARRDLGPARRRRLRRRRRAARAISTLLDARLRAHRGDADRRRRARRRPRPRVEIFGLHLAKLDLRVHASRGPRAGRAAARDARRGRRGCSGGTARGALDRLIVSMTSTRRRRARRRGARRRGRRRRRGRAAARDDRRPARAPASSSGSCSTAARGRRSR